MELLKELLGEELAKQVTDKLGDKKLMLDDGKYIPKTRVDEMVKKAQDERDSAHKQLEAVTAKVKEFEAAAGENETLKKKAQELVADNERIKKEADERLAAQKLDHKLDLELGKFGAKDLQMIKAKLNMDSIKLDGESLTGLKDQVEQLQKDYEWAFGVEKPNPNEPDNPKPDDDKGKNPWKSDQFNLTEQGRITREDPKQAERLKAAAGQ